MVDDHGTSESIGLEPDCPSVYSPRCRQLPENRQAITHKFSIGDHEGHITVGFYDDGKPGEIFIIMGKEGSLVGGLATSLAAVISLALQYGAPLEEVIRTFEGMRFEPAGITKNPQIPLAKSIADYLALWLKLRFGPLPGN